MALERIEHDEELTFEVVHFMMFEFFFFDFLSKTASSLSLQQVLVLETNLFLNGLNIYDQHRDMRLDIDNMTYEVVIF